MDFDVASRIRQLRSERGLSSHRLSILAGLSPSYVRKIEMNESIPTVEVLEFICKALNISLSDFFVHSHESLIQLEAIGILRKLSDEQLTGFCRLLQP